MHFQVKDFNLLTDFLLYIVLPIFCSPWLERSQVLCLMQCCSDSRKSWGSRFNAALKTTWGLRHWCWGFQKRTVVPFAVISTNGQPSLIFVFDSSFEVRLKQQKLACQQTQLRFFKTFFWYIITQIIHKLDLLGSVIQKTALPVRLCPLNLVSKSEYVYQRKPFSHA